jgi:hypothetical protein
MTDPNNEREPFEIGCGALMAIAIICFTILVAIGKVR